jgi:hypothetical protein
MPKLRLAWRRFIIASELLVITKASWIPPTSCFSQFGRKSRVTSLQGWNFTQVNEL